MQSQANNNSFVQLTSLSLECHQHNTSEDCTPKAPGIAASLTEGCSGRARATAGQMAESHAVVM